MSEQYLDQTKGIEYLVVIEKQMLSLNEFERALAQLSPKQRQASIDKAEILRHEWIYRYLPTFDFSYAIYRTEEVYERICSYAEYQEKIYQELYELLGA